LIENKNKKIVFFKLSEPVSQSV